MIQLLQSIWLWSSVAVAVPIIIHLWNIRQGKTLKVGNVALLTERARTHAKSFRLSQLLLLLVRCLLLISMALLVSKPVWEHNRDKSEEGWVLVDRGGLPSAYRQFGAAIDGLLKQNHSLHYFEKGFPQVDLETALKNSANVREDITSSWALLRELNGQIPAALPVHLFTSNRLAQTGDLRPFVSLNLKWYSYADAQKNTSWIEEAYATSDDSIAVIKGRSDSLGTFFQNLRVGGAGNEIFDVEGDGGKTTVILKDTNATGAHRATIVDTATLLMIVYAGNNNTDGGYVRAALRAIADFTKRKIRIILVDKVEKIPAHYSWLFWLSTEQVPPQLKTNNILSYAAGSIHNVHTKAVLSPTFDHARTEDEDVFKMIRQPAARFADVYWQNGWGEPLLARDTSKIYIFYSRFHPQWNNLVWSREFARLMYRLIRSSHATATEAHTRDRRQVDEQQLQPAFVRSEVLLPKEKVVVRTSLSEYLWCFVVLLFLCERMLTYSSSKPALNG